jgi:hypothetical protein
VWGQVLEQVLVQVWGQVLEQVLAQVLAQVLVQVWLWWSLAPQLWWVQEL